MNSRQLLGLVVGASLLAGCGVKKNVAVTTPTDYLNAQTTSRSQLIGIINDRYANVRSLTVPKFKIQLTGGTIEDGSLDVYRNAGGYLVAQREDSIFVNILNPLSNSSVLTMASTDGTFQVWIPSRNQFVTGATEATAADPNPIYNVRPNHILQGLLIEPLPLSDPSQRVTHIEDQDGTRKFYVVMVNDARSGEMRRRIWIERSQLRMIRQQYYRDSTVVSDINYQETVEVDGQLVGARVTIDRPVEKYSVRLQLESDEITLDSPLAASAFQIEQPNGSEHIQVPVDRREEK